LGFRLQEGPVRNEQKRPAPKNPARDRDARSAPRRRRYETPRVVDYGRVSKLTQTGGVTTKDSGNMLRVCL
jgi:hypothetical protein